MTELEKVVVYPQRAGWADLTKEFGAQDETPDLGDDDVPSVVDEIWRRGPINAALKSAGDASIVLDLPLPPADDVDSDDAPLYKAPKVIHGVSGALRKTSDAAFVRVLAKVRSVFDGHPEEYEAAVELVTRIREEARARAIAAAAS